MWSIMDGICVLTQCSDILLSLCEYLSILENENKQVGLVIMSAFSFSYKVFRNRLV